MCPHQTQKYLEEMYGYLGEGAQYDETTGKYIPSKHDWVKYYKYEITSPTSTPQRHHQKEKWWSNGGNAFVETNKIW